MPPPPTQPLKLKPCLSERPWGGRRLETLLHKPLPPEGRFGESWEIADHPDGRSTIAEGPFAGQKFGDLLRRFPRELCNLTKAPDRYPLMVKYLDVLDHLSLQVHPSDEQATPLGERGKSECWYVMQCDNGAELILGLNEGATPETLLEVLRLADPTPHLDEIIRRVPVRPGSFLHVPAGTIHAILGGCVICEVQQSSNLTYRLWDWNRQPPRPLHLDEGFRVIRFTADHHSAHTDTAHWPTDSVLVSNDHFEVRLAVFANPDETSLALNNPHGVIINVVAGSGSWRVESPATAAASGRFQLGETWYLPPAIKRLHAAPGLDALRLLISRSLELD